MAEMKGIKLCGECINYDWKKHKCKIGCNDDSNAQAPFYGDCPLPDVVPKSEVERLYYNLQAVLEERAEPKRELAREIFEEIDIAVENAELEWGTICGVKLCIAELKKKYTEGESNGSKQ